MRNTIKYNKYRSTKFIINKFYSMTLTALMLIMVGAIAANPLVIDADGSKEEIVKVEDLREEIKVAKNDVVTTRTGFVTKNIPLDSTAMAYEAITETDVEADTKEDSGKRVSDILPAAGVAVVLNSIGEDIEIEDVGTIEHKELKAEAKKEPNVIKIRCTGYDDVGYTKSGEWTREGVIAGKEEWLHKKCKLYRINDDGSVGELIGEYTFLDTGYGIKTKTANGIEGSLKLGKSIDVWHPSEDSIWDWMDEYGDYVYMEGPY